MTRPQPTEPMRCGWCITGHHARCRQPCPCDHPSHSDEAAQAREMAAGRAIGPDGDQLATRRV